MDLETVERVATLARIALEDREKQALIHDLTRIVEFVSHLDEVSTEGMDPVVSVGEQKLPMRDDKVTDQDLADQIVANAPESLQQMFVVPKMVE